MAVCTIILLLSLSRSVWGSLQCYDRGGNEDPFYLPCYPDRDVSHCCHIGDICYDNSLCKADPVGPTPFYVGWCTDPSKPSPACESERVCLDEQHVPDVGVQTCASGNYCCYGISGCDCNNSSQVLTLPAGALVTQLPNSTVSIASPTSKSSSATNTNMPSSPISSSLPASSSPTAANTGSSFSQSAKIGVGVGVPIGVLAAAVIAILLWRLHRLKARLRSSKDADAGLESTPPIPYDNDWKQPLEISGRPYQTSRLGNVGFHEMDSQRARVELAGH